MRTPSEIEAEVAALRALRDLVPPTSLLGDDNVAAISAQLDVIENGLTLDGVDVVYGDQADPAFDAYVHEHAIAACDWLEGRTDEAPSEGWHP